MTTTTERTVWQLALMADCADPDTVESAGARFLLSVARDYEERKSYGPVDDGAIHEIADAAPNVYTATRWAEFVDLAAYQEDVTDLASDLSDLTGVTGVALYMIAERLVRALLEADEEADEDE